jgi:VanZ family protein
MYGVLGLLTLRAAAVAQRARGTAVAALVAVALFGALDEWHQQFIPGRSQDTADWLADTLGGGTGILLAAVRPRREPIA